MLSLIVEMLSYPFIVRTVLVGVLVCVCSSLLGVSLVLKRYAMIGDGLSHVGFGALAVATAMNWAPMSVAMPTVIVAAFFLLRLRETGKLGSDSAIAMLSSGALAIGIVVMSLSKGMNIDVYNYMFGTILAVTNEDVVLSVLLSIVVIVVFVVFYSKIFAITFDETFAAATGINAGLYNMMIAMLTAVTIVVGMRLVGSLLISALVIFPALTSMGIFKSFKSVTICSVIVSVVSFFVGITLSFAFSLPAGAAVVCVNVAAYVLFSVAFAISTAIKKRRSLMKSDSKKELADNGNNA